MSTKAKITELIRRRLVDGNPSVNDKIKDPEIHLLIENAVNRLLKAEALNNFNLNEDTLIDGGMLATYQKCKVLRGNENYCRVQLPVKPLSLPGGLGVFSIYPEGNESNEYYPIPAGMYNILKKDRVLSTIQDIFYSISGDGITIYSDLIAAGVGCVDMKLCVADITTLDSNDLLPITADLQGQLVEFVFQSFSIKNTPTA